MRRIFLAFLAAGLMAGFATEAAAQNTRRPPGQQSSDQDRAEQANRRRLDREMQNRELPLPELANSGPCPFVKVLYDAAREIDVAGGLADGRPSSGNIAYSSEIQGLTATCRYQGGEPIVVDINVTFAVGKGPRAQSDQKDYAYFVAVTDRNLSVLAKEQFSFTVDFSKTNSDRVLVFQRISNIVIPRANDRVSGENFEVLVGFNVSPEQAAFNRSGARFVVNATGQQSASNAPSQ